MTASRSTLSLLLLWIAAVTSGFAQSPSASDPLVLKIAGTTEKPSFHLGGEPVGDPAIVARRIVSQALEGATLPEPRPNPFGEVLPPQRVLSTLKLVVQIDRDATHGLLEAGLRGLLDVKPEEPREHVPAITDVTLMVDGAGLSLPIVTPDASARTLTTYLRVAPRSRVADPHARPMHLSLDERFRKRTVARLARNASGVYAFRGRGIAFPKLPARGAPSTTKTLRRFRCAEDLTMQAIGSVLAAALKEGPVELSMLARQDGLLQLGAESRAAIGLAGGMGGGPRMRGARRNLRALGGNGRTEATVQRTLTWLVAAQEADGAWRGEGSISPVGKTSLVLLTLGASGNTIRSGRHGVAVRRGLQWLLAQADEAGRLRPRDGSDRPWVEAVAVAALVEMHGLTPTPVLKQAATRALSGLLMDLDIPAPSRGATMPVRELDRLGWIALALKGAESGGLDVATEARAPLIALATAITGDEAARKNGARRGLALFIRYLLESDVRSRIGESPEATAIPHPTWTDPAQPDWPSHTHFGTLAAFQAGLATWKDWNTAMRDPLLESHQASADDGGHWRIVGPMRERLGPIGGNAMLTTCLQVYYRYARKW